MAVTDRHEYRNCKQHSLHWVTICPESRVSESATFHACHPLIVACRGRTSNSPATRESGPRSWGHVLPRPRRRPRPRLPRSHSMGRSDRGDAASPRRLAAHRSKRPGVGRVHATPARAGRLALARRATPEAAGPAQVGHPVAGEAGAMPPERQPSGPPPQPSAGALRRRSDGGGPGGAAGKRRGAALALPRRLRLSKSVQDPPGPPMGGERSQPAFGTLRQSGAMPCLGEGLDMLVIQSHNERAATTDRRLP